MKSVAYDYIDARMRIEASASDGAAPITDLLSLLVLAAANPTKTFTCTSAYNDQLPIWLHGSCVPGDYGVIARRVDHGGKVAMWPCPFNYAVCDRCGKPLLYERS